MPKIWWALLFVQIVLLSSLHSSYASQSLASYTVNGTITTLGCNILNGTIANQTTNMYPIQICHYDNSYFQIKELTPDSVCSQVITTWKDPSGRVFTFPNPCVGPQFYSPSAGNHTSSQVVEPPLKQMRSQGIPAESVTCAQGLVLMKSRDNLPACVTPDTARKLVQRGWGTTVTQPTFSELSNPANYTSGQKVGVFTISKINPDNVTGYYNSPYPIAHPGLGVFTTMHVGDTLNPTCDGSAPLVITSINYPDSITVSTGKSKGVQPGGCPICLSADSTIKTPEGGINIKDIKDGMAVWSADSDGTMIKSKVIKTSKVFVGSTHQVIDLKLADGRELFASANHPTYDGRTIGDLKVGEVYDGSAVKSADLMPYKHQFTYDILPDSTTGNYFADGILVGSTLKGSNSG